MKLFLQATIKSFKEAVNRSTINNIAMAVTIPAVIIALDWLGMIGGGLLASATLAGIMFIVSVVVILLGMPSNIRRKCTMLMARQGFWIDLALTIVLMAYGFSLGATLGLLAMAVGLNFSLMTSGIRLVMLLCDDSFREDFFGKPMKAKRLATNRLVTA